MASKTRITKAIKKKLIDLIKPRIEFPEIDRVMEECLQKLCVLAWKQYAVQEEDIPILEKYGCIDWVKTFSVRDEAQWRYVSEMVNAGTPQRHSTTAYFHFDNAIPCPKTHGYHP